jgi:hypothetical protein
MPAIRGRSMMTTAVRPAPGLRRRPMSTITYFVAITFLLDNVGTVVASDALECPNPGVAMLRAEALSTTDGIVGALAFSRTGDPDTLVFGQVPRDLAMLI